MAMAGKGRHRARTSKTMTMIRVDMIALIFVMKS